jgi:hypothetical protein
MCLKRVLIIKLYKSDIKHPQKYKKKSIISKIQMVLFREVHGSRTVGTVRSILGVSAIFISSKVPSPDEYYSTQYT